MHLPNWWLHLPSDILISSSKATSLLQQLCLNWGLEEDSHPLSSSQIHLSCFGKGWASKLNGSKAGFTDPALFKVLRLTLISAIHQINCTAFDLLLWT